MRIWTTVSLLLTGCMVAPSQPEGGLDPGPTNETSDSSEALDDADENADENAGGFTNGFVPEDDILPDPDACEPMHPECEPGHKCAPVRDQNSDFVGRCVPIADETVGIGERCVPLDEPGHDNCEDGSVCWDIMNGEGTCLGFCEGTGDNPSCDEGFVCNWGKSWSFGLCTPVCDPLSTSDCPETCGCYWANSDFFCLPRTSNIATGEPCGFINDCAPLNMCVTSEVLPDCAGSSCCATFCDLGVGGCGEGTSCVAFFEDGTAPPDYQHIGICIVPEA